jgi:hypothetical protein
MPTVSFTPNLQRHIELLPQHVPGGSVREALEAAFAAAPRARGYVLEDDGSLRQHMVVFVDGAPLHDRRGLSDPVTEASSIYVMQALSGG